MKDDDTLPVSMSFSRKEISDSTYHPFGRGRYKFWALTALLLLAFCSILTGTVTLRWSLGNLNRFSDEFDKLNSDDLDALELEERAVVVNHMWDVYTNSRRIRLPRFWQEAFVSAYEYLTSDDSGVREAAVSEIAKMSLRSLSLDLPPSSTIQQLPSKEEGKAVQQETGMGKNEKMSSKEERSSL
ncbi:uncharacterized protein LOC124916527 [Impatiens glandulifera]|uniref:uncharacterized protein LOC124916527 n=1 Tax=Impatiens glandulifera TaxID=253017 RepID=UPI001FB17F28|nr:uncharacterized protein LOC124916527 [Impatiens glandulifera]XP_047313214.1 uncharacterized protein LOC124916527 [Impatiens glandulifera]